MEYFICYDISDDGLRGKTARLLEERGCKRVQRSVFLAPGFTVREIGELRQRVAGLIAPKLSVGDSILCFPVEKDRLEGLIWHGENGALGAALENIPVKVL